MHGKVKNTLETCHGVYFLESHECVYVSLPHVVVSPVLLLEQLVLTSVTEFGGLSGREPNRNSLVTEVDSSTEFWSRLLG